MKATYYILLLLIVSACKKNEPAIPTNSELRLQRIKSEDGRLQNEFQYRPDGKALLQKSYSPSRKTPDEIRYFYDEQGQLAKIETSTLGHLSCAACEGPAMKFVQTFEYNAAGQVAQTLHQQENGSLTNRWTHEYDGSGRLVRRSSTAPTGVKGNYVTYDYDSRGNMVKIETFAADGRLTNRDTYQYDARLNPFQPVYLGSYIAFFRSPNNVVRTKSEFLSPNGGPTSEGSVRYDYDLTTGYPVRAEYENGSVSVFEYK
ncbi:MAG: hypothetical protein LH606_19420 [Cytophagaceae bacterium]|nr:hypothetical protein [Cytophagaceae bacterium]